MARLLCFALLVVVVAWCGVGRATSPDNGRSPNEAATPSPNQSLSIDDDQAIGRNNQVNAQVVQPTDQKSESAPASSDTNDTKPIFLGRRQIPSGAASTASHAETPWYRSSLGALGLVLALMALLYMVLKRWAPSLKVQDGGLIRVMSRTVVGPRQSLLMVRIGQRLVVVGISPDRVERVCEIADSEEVAALTRQSAGRQSKAEFSAWLDREAAEFARTETRGGTDEADSRSLSGSKPLSELLRNLKSTKV